MPEDESKDNDRYTEISISDPLARAIIPQGENHSVDLDISRLSDEERAEITKGFQQGLVDIRLRAASLGVDVTALRATLQTLSQTTEEIASTEGSSVTITHTQDSAAGRTEIIMGNTEQAQRGRLTRSQTGDRDLAPFYLIGGAIVITIIVLAVLLR